MEARESPSAFWNRRYEAADRLWTAEPNAFLVDFAAGLEPGRALDLGAGEGRNAVWLAKRGWRVTALDVSDVGLARAARRAEEEGVAVECVVADWREHALPAASFDLVVIAYMHPRPDERPSMYGCAADALAPGGHLFVVGVHAVDHGRRGPPDPERLLTPERMRERLPAGLELLRCESSSYERERDGERTSVTDVVAIARRPPHDQVG